jgi:hypothetical protein
MTVQQLVAVLCVATTAIVSDAAPPVPLVGWVVGDGVGEGLGVGFDVGVLSAGFEVPAVPLDAASFDASVPVTLGTVVVED